LNTEQLKFKKVLKLLFILSIIFYVILILTFITSIMQLVLIEIYQSSPIILPLALFYYCIVDTFTPNKKHSSFYGWLYAEFLEHLILPLVLVLIIFSIPWLFVLSYIILIFYFYGFYLGEIKSTKDLISILVLVALFNVLAFYPDLVLFINVSTNMGRLFITLNVIICGVLYFINKLRYKSGVEVFKGITVIGIMHLSNALLWTIM